MDPNPSKKRYRCKITMLHRDGEDFHRFEYGCTYLLDVAMVKRSTLIRHGVLEPVEAK